MDADDFKKIEDMFKRHVDVASENFKHHVGIMSESINQKLDLIIATQHLMGEKLPVPTPARRSEPARRSVPNPVLLS
jgi:hypothetical protein